MNKLKSMFTAALVAVIQFMVGGAALAVSLPVGYQRLEYIETKTGLEYLDTGVPVSSAVNFALDANVTSFGELSILLGGGNSGRRTMVQMKSVASKGLSFTYGNKTSEYVSHPFVNSRSVIGTRK